jgi:hypothetical protein
VGERGVFVGLGHLGFGGHQLGGGIGAGSSFGCAGGVGRGGCGRATGGARREIVGGARGCIERQFWLLVLRIVAFRHLRGKAEEFGKGSKEARIAPMGSGKIARS